MSRRFTAVPAALAAGFATPALAASDKPFFSLGNSDFVVLIAFVVFIGILLYFKVPGLLMGQLDKRAETIRSELDEARSLREEAQTLLASFERKSGEVSEQAERIVAAAREDARQAADQAQADLDRSIARRLKAAEEQIASAEEAAVRRVRDRAVDIAIAAAGEVIAKQMGATESARLVDDAIATVEKKLH